MVVTVYLHTILQRQTPDGPQRQMDVTLLSGSTLANLLQDLGFEFSMDMDMLVNGHAARPEDILKQGDQIDLIPASA